MDWKRFLLEQAESHPALGPQDAVKLCFQAVYGAEHLLEDEAGARKYLEAEYGLVNPAAAGTKDALEEPVSDCFSRVNIGAWKRRGLPCEWLFQMFLLTASTPGIGGEGEVSFREGLAAVTELSRSGKMSFDAESWGRYLAEYEKHGIRPVHHSDGYRRAENPSYRVVNRRYLRLLPLLERLALWGGSSRAMVIALDGRCASGKTTAAKALERILGAGIVHMDDFFLPGGLRTPERFAQPGGNVHYERFREEALPFLHSAGAFHYRRFDCGRMELGEERSVRAGKWRIVEGAYSCHPVLGDYMDLRVFSDIGQKEQLKRIRGREGEAAVEAFAKRWIPLEEAYFQEYGILERSDIVLSDAGEGAKTGRGMQGNKNK